MEKLPAAINAGLTGAKRDASAPLPTVLRHGWTKALAKSFVPSGDLFTSSAAAGVPGVIFAETSHLYTDLKKGVVTATVHLHAVNIKADKITTTTALGTALLEEVGKKSSYLAAKSFSTAEQQAIADGAYRAALQLATETKGAPLPSTFVPAPDEEKQRGTLGCACNTGVKGDDSASSGLLFSLMCFALFCWWHRR